MLTKCCVHRQKSEEKRFSKEEFTLYSIQYTCILRLTYIYTIKEKKKRCEERPLKKRLSDCL